MSEEAREVALARVARSPHARAFTGADLQAVVDTAQLAAIHCYLEVSDTSEHQSFASSSVALEACWTHELVLSQLMRSTTVCMCRRSNAEESCLFEQPRVLTQTVFCMCSGEVMSSFSFSV